jgi:hypothetical protein
VLKLRGLWTFAMTWVTKLAMYTWEPLVVLGPAALSLLTIPGVFFTALVVFGVVAVVRLVAHEIQIVRRRRRHGVEPVDEEWGDEEWGGDADEPPGRFSLYRRD